MNSPDLEMRPDDRTTASPPPAGRDRQRVVFWSLHTGYWLFFWTASSLLVRIFTPAIAQPERAIAIHVITAFCATALVHWLVGRERFMRQFGLSPLGLVIGGAICIAVAQSLLQDRLPALAGTGALMPSRRWAVAMLIARLTGLLGWALSYLMLRLIEDQRATMLRALEARAEADRNELRFFQAQMDPHFLFNALNAVIACKDEPEKVETVAHSLAEYLRFALRETAPLEPLGRELDALTNYLTVQEIRFGADLECTVDCERQARAVLVPPMLVQPLLENAFKYGARTSDMPLRVGVAARLADGMLELDVANTGRWVAPDPRRSSGIGLRTLRKRLLLLCGPAATLEADGRDGWVHVVVRIPPGQPAQPQPLAEAAP